MPLPKEHTYTIKISIGRRTRIADRRPNLHDGGTDLSASGAFHGAFCHYPELYSQQKRFLSGSAGPIGCLTFFEYRYEEDAAPLIAPFDQTLTVGIYGDFEINIAKLLEEAGIK